MQKCFFHGSGWMDPTRLCLEEAPRKALRTLRAACRRCTSSAAPQETFTGSSTKLWKEAPCWAAPSMLAQNTQKHTHSMKRDQFIWAINKYFKNKSIIVCIPVTIHGQIVIADLIQGHIPVCDSWKLTITNIFYYKHFEEVMDAAVTFCNFTNYLTFQLKMRFYFKPLFYLSSLCTITGTVGHVMWVWLGSAILPQ